MAIITISRQVGSLGDEIAHTVADKLGYQLIGHEQLHQLAESCDKDFKDACRLFEKEVQPSFFERFFFNTPAYTSLFESLNLELASRGDVVIIGRGAQIALSKLPGILKVRTVAPLQLRVERVSKIQGVSYEEADHFVRKHDHERRALIKTVFEKDLGDFTLYDLILNTKTFSVEAGADLIIKAAEEMRLEHQNDQLREWIKTASFAKKIESAIRKEIHTSFPQTIEVTADSEGKVTIYGYVPKADSKNRAQKIVEGFTGVKEIDNRLKTTELRY